MQVKRVINRILVTTDFSQESTVAFDYAADFAHKSDGRITLLTVVDLPGFVPYGNLAGYSGGIEGLKREVADSAAVRLREWASQAQAFAGLSVETVVRQGIPSHEIAAAARELGSDLIVIATHGHTGLANVLIGSVAEKVVRLAPCPVLTVKTSSP